MPDNLRDALELRTIRVSALAALHQPHPVEVRERIKDRADELLAKLEARILKDGASEDMLNAIEATRRELRDSPFGVR